MRRSETEIFKMIAQIANNDKRVRAVTIEGSKVNDAIPKDEFQDYDISFFVTEIDSFRSHPAWIDVFGERIILQMPEAMSLYPPQLGNWFSYLMLLKDGNRIDLTLIPVGEVELYSKGEAMIKVLHDKDGLFPFSLKKEEDAYWIKHPSEEYLIDCCNEFWWVSTYVAKGLARQEILYATHHLNQILRPCLLQMMAWKVGIERLFSVDVGKHYKYLDAYISAYEWELLMLTYDIDDYDDCWQTLDVCIDLFRQTARFVAAKLGYTYNELEDENVSQYLNAIQLSC